MKDVRVCVKRDLMNQIMTELEARRDYWAKEVYECIGKDFSDELLEVYISECAYFDQLIEEIIGTSYKQIRSR